jgi:colanic acid/amylovoran biosynthesis glycosyltransferase
MKIAVFTNQFPSKVSTFFATDMKALLDCGISIEIFPLYPIDHTLWQHVPEALRHQFNTDQIVHSADFSGSRISQLRALCGGWFRLPQDSLKIACSSLRYGPRSLAKSLYALLKAHFWFEHFRGDYDHVLSYWGNYSATAAYIFHRLKARAIPFSFFLHAGTDLYRQRIFLKHKLLYASRVITVCEFNRRFLQETYPDIYPVIGPKVHIHHIGVDLTELAYSPERNHHEKKLVAVGTLTKVKGFDFLLRAIKHLKTSGVLVELDLVGDGEESDNLKTLASDLELTNQVRFRGWLRPSEVKSFMRAATLLVHPSVGLGDAVPTVIKESMALGTPVVASNVAGIPELLAYGRCGRLVPPQDPASLAEAISELLANRSEWEKISRRAREYAEQTFDMTRNGRQLAAVLRAVNQPTY